MHAHHVPGSFVGLNKMLQAPDEHTTKPEKEHVKNYFSGAAFNDEETAKLIEFTSTPAIAAGYATQSRCGYVLTVQVKKKYLTKSGDGIEADWMAKQAAPYKIVGIQRVENLTSDVVALTEAELREAAKKEEMADFI
ncbi:hypothetical protein AB0I49_21415 [Streptomyces sp. NPDC050617]|uniref:hypothetical protein n=1 Tax=Streptomyces sp. NPDC050617 TaxID=3154628 RepID=UPI003440B923